MSDEKLLSIQDVAVILGMKKSNIYTMTRKKLIPFYRIGDRLIRFKQSEIEAWIMQKKEVNQGVS